MTAFIFTLLRLSLLGSLLAGILFLLKPLLRGRVSRTASYYLWLLVLLRLCVPAGLTLSLPAADTSVVPGAGQTAAPMQGALEDSAAAQGTAAPQTEPTPAVPTPAPAAVPPTAVTERLLTGIWAAGFVLVGGWYIHGYCRVRRTIRRTAVPAGAEANAVLAELEPRGGVRLIESAAVNSPLLLGVFCPTVVLPVGITDPARLRDILSHELTHARRYDLLFKWFAAFAASVHWFNPLLIFIRREISRACELACDEAVVKDLDAPARKHYGETLLLLAAEAPALPLAVTLCEEKRTLKERLESIVKIHKRTPAAVGLTLALVLALGGCALFTGTEHAQAPQGLTDPESGMTIRLDMTREEVEALLGPGELQYEGSSYYGTTHLCTYDTDAGPLRINYENGRVEQIAIDKLYFPELDAFRWTTEEGISWGSTMEQVQRKYQRWAHPLLFHEGGADRFYCQSLPGGEAGGVQLGIGAREETGVNEIILQRTYAAAPTGFVNPSTGAEVELYQTRAEIEESLDVGRGVGTKAVGTMKQRIYDGYIDGIEEGLAGEAWSGLGLPIYVEDGTTGTITQHIYDGYTIADPSGEPIVTWSPGGGDSPEEASGQVYGYSESQDIPDYTEADISGNIIYAVRAREYSVAAYGEGADTLYVFYRQDVAVGFSTWYHADTTAAPWESSFRWQLDGLACAAAPEEAEAIYPGGSWTELEDADPSAQAFQYYNGSCWVELGAYDGKVGSLCLTASFPG